MSKRNQYNRRNFSQIPELTFTSVAAMSAPLTIALSASLEQNIPLSASSDAIIDGTALTGTHNHPSGLLQFDNITLATDESFTFVLNNNRFLSSSAGISTLLTNTLRLVNTYTTLSASVNGQVKIRLTHYGAGVAGASGFINYRIIGDTD